MLLFEHVHYAVAEQLLDDSDCVLASRLGVMELKALMILDPGGIADGEVEKVPWHGATVSSRRAEASQNSEPLPSMASRRAQIKYNAAKRGLESQPDAAAREPRPTGQPQRPGETAGKDDSLAAARHCCSARTHCIHTNQTDVSGPSLAGLNRSKDGGGRFKR